MTGTTPQCAYIGGHRDGYDPECWWCVDNAAWDFAGRVAAAHMAKWKREADERSTRLMIALLAFFVLTAVVWMAVA